MIRSFRGFGPRFMKEVDRVIPAISFLPSSTQPAVVETITVRNISNTLTIALVNTIEVSNGRLTQGSSNDCTISLGDTPIGMKIFAGGSFS